MLVLLWKVRESKTTINPFFHSNSRFLLFKQAIGNLRNHNLNIYCPKHTPSLEHFNERIINKLFEGVKMIILEYGSCSVDHIGKNPGSLAGR